MTKRLNVFLSLIALIVFVSGFTVAVPDAQASEKPIIVGSILDETGGLNVYGKPMVDATKLAIKDINANGGVLGRSLKLISYDAQSDNAKYTQYANKLALQDKASVIMGGITSASREALRPVLNRFKTLYFYNEQYEGGVCDKNVFATGIVPSQQIAPLIPWTVKNVGPKIYILAADYNYGHISTDWVKHYAKQFGGEVVGTDFIPLEVADFSSIINKLQDAKPDAIFSLLVGGNHIAFYRQFKAAGLDKSMKIVSATFGLGNEQIVLAPSEGEGIVTAYPYMQELNNPANKKFVKMWHQEYGKDYPYITDSAATVWTGWHLWAKAVELAGTLEREKVIAALESGIEFEAPSGTVKIDGPSHHVIQNVSIGKTNDKKGFSIIATNKLVPPSFEQQMCDTIKNPRSNKQFTPGGN